MITINVIGRLGMDAEVKETKNGGKYVTLRLATDEYRNGKNETVWLNVFDYSERGLKMAQHWKKGTLLNICGTETVTVYQSKQNGAWLPSRDIRAFSVDFVNGGGSGATQSTSEVAATQQTAPTVGTFEKPTEVKAEEPSFSTSVTADSGDDLPF